MGVTAADARRWLQGFEDAGRADREAKRAQGPRLEWSVSLALSQIDAARTAAGGRPLLDPRRAEQVEAVRQVWARLRTGLLHR
jgi:hypothetical protein